ncbi:hypothetical protein BT69DRAFT_1297219 [Atractiella rhizophila]|nr:hypothetical protein BT69DRAFT_1297219 [Atractiella rhizophila]
MTAQGGKEGRTAEGRRKTLGTAVIHAKSSVIPTSTNGKIADFSVKDAMKMNIVWPKVTYLKKVEGIALEHGLTTAKREKYGVLTALDGQNGTLQGFYELRGDCTTAPSRLLLTAIAALSCLCWKRLQLQDRSTYQWMNVVICGCKELVLLDSSQTQPRDARKTIAIDTQERKLASAKMEEGEDRIAYSGRVAEIMKEVKVADRGLDGIDLAVDCMGLRIVSPALLFRTFGHWCIDAQMTNENRRESRPPFISSRTAEHVSEQANDLVSKALVDSKLLITHSHRFKRAIPAFMTTWTLSDDPSL